ncbi:histidine ammonia-lyase [Amycolatopsis sp. WQ 127309]|uniref:HAL/PAL/TAL family ammonia-lyase n=1 Tax=Amycolatopsis sp. WQ 127309 TaxID=2932773 RepID=UPI001FF65526|nr:aromatic amino acid ammonia-lyase [Amycolatopsis sp. WQ 127309]UOZ07010.1 aromatic amino acid ammonia-lyase [Amycolatopsis sp. WQ 127309]
MATTISGNARRLLEVDGDTLTTAVLTAAARVPGSVRPVLAAHARKNCTASAELRESIVAGAEPVYGVTTGFGDSASRQVSPERAAALQRNLVRYHLNGTGPAAAPDVVRATMLVRANCLAKGVSGVRPVIVDNLLRLLDADVLPIIPERGSVGASGDLVPLCYLATVLQGEGQVRHAGTERSAAEAHRQLGLAPVTLEAKEGLALINGTSFMSGFAVLAAADAAELAFAAEVCSALAVEVLRGNRGHYAPFLHDQKAHPGQVASAGAMATYLADSSLALDHAEIVDRYDALSDRKYQQLPRRVQDSYSVRCAPHVIGVLRDTLAWVDPWLTVEINSANDNPLFDVEAGVVRSGGNFYGGHVGQAMDSLKVAVASVADLLDRQLELMVDEKFNNGLTPNLISFSAAAEEPGLHHGYKGMQIACSALTAEALKQAGPATVFSRSTEAHNQDKVSMATIAARDARTVGELALEVLAIHLHAACQGLDLRETKLRSTVARRVYEAVREFVAPLDRDRQMDGEIQDLAEFIRSGRLREVVTGG